MKTSLRSFGNFIEAQIGKMEHVDPKYGDFRKYSTISMRRHLLSEFEEWKKKSVLQDFDKWNPTLEKEELIDIANLCYFLWAIIQEEDERQHKRYRED